MKNLKIYDNGGSTFDRYTAIYLNRPQRHNLFEARGMSRCPTHPQGFGQYTVAADGSHLGREISFEELPEDCKKLIESDLKMGEL